MDMRKAPGLYLLLALILWAACDQSMGEIYPDAKRDARSMDAGTATVAVGPAGGTYLFFGGRLKLEVPAGALAEPTAISTLVTTSHPEDPNLVPGTVYDLLPDGLVFKKPVKLSIVYEPKQVPSTTSEPVLRIHKVVGSGWSAIPGGGVDTVANLAWARINGFSKYGIKGPSPTAMDGPADSARDAGRADTGTPDVGPPEASILDAASDFMAQCAGQSLGTPCDDGEPCTKGDSCDAKGGCKGTAYTCKPGLCNGTCDGKGGCTNAFKPKGTLCDDKRICTLGDVCDGIGNCMGKSLKSGFCLITGLCFGDGALHPSVNCYRCDVTKSQSVWTPDPNSCMIGGKCYNSGDFNAVKCAQCAPASSTTTWTVQGSACLIKGTCRNAGSTDPVTCGACDPAKDKYAWTATSSCVIDGACYAGGAKEPSGCGVCSVTSSKTMWTRPKGCPVTFQWSRAFGDMGGSDANAVAVDAAGNVYVAGALECSAVYKCPGISFGGKVHKSSGGMDSFIASFTSAGKHRWSKAFGSGKQDWPLDITAHAGGVVLTGVASASIDFGGGPLPSQGATREHVLASFSSGGAHLWSRRHGHKTSAHESAVAVDAKGNVHVAGAFATQPGSTGLTFGGASHQSIGNVHAGTKYGNDVFVFKIGP